MSSKNIKYIYILYLLYFDFFFFERCYIVDFIKKDWHLRYENVK